MDFTPLLKGMIVGLAIAAPAGPIGVLCIRRALTEGRVSGFASGLGAASADAVYGLIAALGLTFVSAFLMEDEAWFRALGGAFLVILGVRIFLKRPAERAAPNWESSLIGAYASTFFLTLTNPMTILSFAGIFAGLREGGETVNYLSTMLLVLGVFLGSALWWLLLSVVVGLFRTKFALRGLRDGLIGCRGRLSRCSVCSLSSGSKGRVARVSVPFFRSCSLPGWKKFGPLRSTNVLVDLLYKRLRKGEEHGQL